jgi:DNA repair protein RecO (recombination protein O)
LNRFINVQALALRVRESGEANREAFFLTSEFGIIRAIVYGGPKSKLRSYVSPNHAGTLYLYYDPVRDSYKVSDFDVSAWRPGLREMYERSQSAGAIAETILASDGGGASWDSALRLANASLEALSNADAETVRRVTLHFLWNWAEILGVRPELDGGEAHISIKNPAALRWLKSVEKLPPSQLSQIPLDEMPMYYAKTLCTEILASALGRQLSSWSNI